MRTGNGIAGFDEDARGGVEMSCGETGAWGVGECSAGGEHVCYDDG